MKHTFRVTAARPTHVRTSDSAEGILREYPDTVNTWSTVLVDPADFTIIPEPPEPVSIPYEIANWRARAVLEIAGLLDDVVLLLDSMTGDEGIVARAAWNSGAPFVRNGPTVSALSAALLLTEEQVDAMFLQAAALNV